MDFPKTISLLHRKMNTELNVRLTEIGLTNAKARLLKYLYDNGEMTQSDLCRELELDKSTVAKALARMESKGLITKKTHPNDTRSFLVSLTTKAIQIVPKTDEVFLGWTEDVTSCMTETEKELFCKLLFKVSQQAATICNKQHHNLPGMM